MKIIKSAFALISFLLLSFLLISFFRELDQESLYHSDQVLTISSWNQRVNKKTIFKKIGQETDRQKISLYKITNNINSSRTLKYIYPFAGSAHTKGNFQNFDTSKKNQILTASQLQARDVRGDYFIRGKINQQQFLSLITKLGLKASFQKTDLFSWFASYARQEGILLSVFSLLLMNLLILFHERSNHFKEYAVKRLHGYSILKILAKDLRQDWTYFLLPPAISAAVTILFLIISPYHGQLPIFSQCLVVAYAALIILLFLFNLISYTLLILIDVPQMVKGKRPYGLLRTMTLASKLAMLFIASLLIIQNITALTSLNTIQSNSRIWRKVNNYYSLYFAPINTSTAEDSHISEKFNQLFADENQHGAVLVKNNNAFDPPRNSYIAENGNVLIVNRNFLSLYAQFSKHTFPTQQIDRHKTLNLFLPKQAQNKQAAIEKDFTSWLHSQRNDSKHPLAVSFAGINMKKDDHIFTFNSRASITKPYADAPLVVLLPNKVIQGDFYYAAATNGSIFFKNYHHLSQNLQRYGLTRYIAGITSFKDDIARQISNLDQQIFLLSMTTILVIFVFLLSLIMANSEYFQQNQKLILVRKLYGYSLFKQHGKHLLISLSSSALVFLVLFRLSPNPLMTWIALYALISEVLISLINILALDKQSITQVKEL